MNCRRLSIKSAFQARIEKSLPVEAKLGVENIQRHLFGDCFPFLLAETRQIIVIFSMIPAKNDPHQMLKRQSKTNVANNSNV